MFSLTQAKNLGGIGSILILLSIVPYAGTALALVGFILVLIAVKYISDYLADRSIFNNMLISVILAIAGIIIAAVFIVTIMFTYFGGFMYPMHDRVFIGQRMSSFFPTFIIGLAIIWIFFIISAIFLRRSYRAIASELKISMFDTASLLYLIGAALSIILVGFVVIYIAEILQTVAFFSIPEEVPTVPPRAAPVQPL